MSNWHGVWARTLSLMAKSQWCYCSLINKTRCLAVALAAALSAAVAVANYAVPISKTCLLLVSFSVQYNHKPMMKQASYDISVSGVSTPLLYVLGLTVIMHIG